MLFRNRMLGGGVSFLPFMAPDDGTGAAAAATGADAGAAGATAAAAASAATGAAADKGATDKGAVGDKTLAGAGADGADAGAAARAAAAAGPAKFPDKWREELAGEDKDALKDLAKYTDPKSVYKSLRDLQTKVSKGELRAPAAPLPENATDEQKAEYRKTHGLPDKPEAFVEKLALPNGVVIGETDKPLVGGFAKMALDKGWSQGQFNEAVGWFYEAQATQRLALEEADGAGRIASEVELRGEWGPAGFKENMAAVGSVLSMIPEALRGEMLTARTPTGQLLGNTAAFNRWAAELGRELNPAATLIPAGGGDAVKTVGDEIKAIESKMYLPDGRQNPEYWKGSGGETMQARYRELVDAQQKMQERGKKAA